MNELLYDLEIPLLDLYPKEVKPVLPSDLCTPMLAAASFTIVTICEQPKCLSMDEWKDARFFTRKRL